MKSWSSVTDHMRYKYLLLVDGFASKWTRDFWSLHTNSCTKIQMSDLNNWFYPLMKANVHYLSVANDVSELQQIDFFGREKMMTLTTNFPKKHRLLFLRF